MKKFLAVMLLLLSGVCVASAQRPIIDYVEKLQQSDNKSVGTSLYSEDRDPRTHKLRTRIIVLEVTDEAVIAQLKKLFFRERENAEWLSLREDANSQYYISFNQGKITCTVKRKPFGRWEVRLVENKGK